MGTQNLGLRIAEKGEPRTFRSGTQNLRSTLFVFVAKHSAYIGKLVAERVTMGLPKIHASLVASLVAASVFLMTTSHKLKQSV